MAVAGLLLSILLSPTYTSADTLEDYPVPGHGELRFVVPDAWQVRYIYTEDGAQKPWFQVFPLAGDAFEMSVSVYWHDGLDEDITDAERLRQRVTQAGEQALKGSTDSAVSVAEFPRLPTPGFLYDLEDAKAADGEYRFLTQGALVVGDLVMAFTILTRDRPSAERDDCLQFLRAMRQIIARHGVSMRPFSGGRQRKI